MAVEVQQSADRLVVEVTWDKDAINGELVKLYCVNPDNGDVSESGLSVNDGTGSVSYPAGYTGKTEVTVYDNHGNADFGVVEVEEGEATTPDDNADLEPTHPIVLPPESGLEPTHPIALPDPHPEHPIVLPPNGIWPSPPEGSVLPEHPIAPGGEGPHPEHPIVIPPEGPGDFYPSHPIVIPPEGGYNPPPGASVPTPQE